MSFTPEEIALLKQGASAVQTGQAVYAPQAHLAGLQTAGYVEVNVANVDGAGAVQFRASPSGSAFLASLPPAPPVPAAAAAWGASPPPAPVAAPVQPVTVAGGFQVGGGFVIPTKATKKAATGGTRSYPFESLDINGWVFVPNRPGMNKKGQPHDAKQSLASTINSANKRYAETNPRRFFRTFRAKAGQDFGGGIVAPSDGAYIVRVEPPVEGAE